MTATSPSSQALVEALNRIAKENNAQEVGWAEKAKRRILRALNSEKNKKLRIRRYDKFIRSRKNWKQSPRRSPGIKQATDLVTEELKRKRWGRGEKPSEKGLSDIATRAAQILTGSKSKSRKNFVEAEAEKLASEILPKWKQEWSPLEGDVGRPLNGRTFNDTHPLSLDELVAVVVPIIEEIANTKLKVVVSDTDTISEISSPTFAALVAAIRTHLPRTNLESMARAVARVRRRPARETVIRFSVDDNILE